MIEASNVALALDRLTINDLCGPLGLPQYTEGKAALCPFHKEKSGSFYVHKGGKTFKCFGCSVGGGLLDFVRARHPAWDKRQVFDFVVERAGLSDRQPSKADKAKRARMQRDIRAKAQKAAAAELQRIPELTNADPWAPEIAQRWQAGNDLAATDNGARSRLCASRGWSQEWHKDIVKRGLIAYPYLPWADPGTRNAGRGWAFPVQVPDFTSGKGYTLYNVGYHQRFSFDHGKTKQWVFIPYIPAESKARNEYTKALHAAGRRCNAFPFVTPCEHPPRAVVIVEGQWDALTLRYAIGYSVPVLILGLRGASGILPLIAAWGEYLKREALPVVLIADGDAAGGQWFTTRNHSAPCFADRLERGLGLRVVKKQLRPAEWGKDLNDLHKRQPITREAFTEFLNSEGLVAK